MVWFYIALVLVTAAGIFLVGRLLKDKADTRRLVGAWICLVGVVGTFLMFALEDDHSPLMLAIGTIFMVASVLVLLVYSRRTTGRQS
jgi:uncharacterized membrane protein HdeD (DUF308 family)